MNETVCGGGILTPFGKTDSENKCGLFTASPFSW